MSKKLTVNGVEYTPADKATLDLLVAKTSTFNSETMPLQAGDKVTFISDEIFAKDFNGQPYATLAAKVVRGSETLEGFISQSSLQAMNMLTANPVCGSEKFEQINPKFSGLNCVDLAKLTNGKTYSIEKIDGFRVANWVDDTTKAKKTNGLYPQKAETVLNSVTGFYHIATKPKSYNRFN